MPGFRTSLTELMGIELPIAGVGSIATAELAAAVTNAGGLGMTGAAGDPPAEVIARVRRIRELTAGPIGVNVTDIFEIGWPGRRERALRNATVDAWDAEPEPRVRPSDRPVEVIARRPAEGGDLEIPRWWVDTPHAGDAGAVEEMALYAGSAAGLVDAVLPAAEIVRRVAAEAELAWQRLAGSRA